MSIATFTIDGREYVVIPKEEYRPTGRRPRPSKRTRGKAKGAQQRPERWLSANWTSVVRKAKANTKRLTGKTHL